MKKIALILVLLVFASAKGFSQNFFQKITQKLEFGIKAGGNYSNFDNTSFTTDYLPGFHAGATVAYKVTDNFLIQEEFLYSQQGAKIKSGLGGDQDIKLSYMTVPFLLKYRSNSGLYIEGGAQVGIKIKEDIAGFSNGDFVKKTDMGAVGGIGFQSKIGLGIGARYIYGISKIGNTTGNGINNDFRSSNIQASIFYVF